MRHQHLALAAGSRAIWTLTALSRLRGQLPVPTENTDFLTPAARPEESGEGCVLRAERRLSERLLELFVHSPALGRVVGVRVLLPANYQDVAQVPVLYLLHGSGDDFRVWTDFGGAEEITASSPYLVVMPDGGAAGYSDFHSGPRSAWQTFHTRELPAFVEGHFAASSERKHRVIAGLSMGGYGAMKYAATMPDRYAAAAAFSSPLNPLAAPMLFEIISMREGGGPSSLFGTRRHDRAVWQGNSPWHLAENLREVHLTFSAASGKPTEDTEEYADTLEAGVFGQGQAFSERLRDLGIAHRWNPRPYGNHNWALWRAELAEWLEDLPKKIKQSRRAERSGRRSPRSIADGGTFSYVTVQPVFELHGWRVEISRRRPQLIRFGDVSAAGFSLGGSGTARLVTPDVYQPGESYQIDVAGGWGQTTLSATADGEGRLGFDLRLGPALHDPIVPGPRTAHFRELGDDAMSRVVIRAAVAGRDEAEAAPATARPAVSTGR